MAASKANRQKEAWTIFGRPAAPPREKGHHGGVDARSASGRGHGRPSVADEAIGHLPRGGAEIEAMAAKAELFRQRVALPPPVKSAVPVDKEPAYVADFFATANVIQSAEPVKARPPVEAFAAAYPDSAGADLLACELEMRAERRRRPCSVARRRSRNTAMQSAPTSSWGCRQPALGILGLPNSISTAIRQDPGDAEAWRALARLFRAQKANGQLEQLARRYQAAFSAPLPQ